MLLGFLPWAGEMGIAWAEERRLTMGRNGGVLVLVRERDDLGRKGMLKCRNKLFDGEQGLLRRGIGASLQRFW